MIEFSAATHAHSTAKAPVKNRRQPAKCRMHDGHSCNLHESWIDQFFQAIVFKRNFKKHNTGTITAAITSRLPFKS
jgi:hypothetical protein